MIAAVLCGCGDNTLPVGLPLQHSRDLAIVAHSDDDLVYLQPDQLERARRGGATIVYVTDGRTDADRRHAGIMFAYSAATGFVGWECGWIDVIGHAVEHCRLEDAHLSLVFLGYPEGDPAGTDPTSVARLWSGTLDIAISIGDLTTAYRRDDVLDMLIALVDLTQPRTVRTLDTAGIHGIDHADHAVVGAAALLAVAGHTTEPADEPLPEVIAFRADGTGADPATLIDPLFERSAGVLAFYDGCVERSAPCGEPAAVITEAHARALRRRYAMSFRRGSGQLRLGIGATCMEPLPSGLVGLVGCPSNVDWRLDADGTLHVGDECIEVIATTGELVVVSSCAPRPNRRFFLDDEGHLWSGARPPIGPGGAMYCVSVGSDPQASRCGSDTSTLWELSPSPTQVTRPAGLPIGRAVQLGDLGRDGNADLCAVIGGNLRCAAGNGTGQFGALADVAPFAVEPESLTLGDVDGDGTLDACGRDVAGLVCLIAPQFTTQRWSPAFARSGPANATDRSLAAIDSDNNGTAEICGVGPAGVICATQDPLDLPEVRSPWPDPTAPAWLGDLDGDRRADWCSRTPMSISCGLDLLSPVTADGVPWTYSLSGIGDPAPADVATGTMADVDGDGRSDLCGIFDRDSGPQIACARSQGFGFGPLATQFSLPAGAYVGLYLGDLDGDGLDDACADNGVSLFCARSH